jgi:hypothetical protein
MSQPGEIHELSYFCEISDGWHFLFNADDARKHIENNRADFGVDFSWLFECLVSAISQQHKLSCNHPILSKNEFELPKEYENLIFNLEKNAFVYLNNNKVFWSEKATPILGMTAWGILTKDGKGAREEIYKIWIKLPNEWKQRIIAAPYPGYSNLLDDLQDLLSNHWYLNDWHDDPVRGERERISMRYTMHDRAAYLWHHAHYDLETKVIS